MSFFTRTPYIMMDVRRLKPAGAEEALSTHGHGFGNIITRFIRRKRTYIYKHNLKAAGVPALTFAFAI